MRGYLLDTNAVSDWLLATLPRHQAVSAMIARLPEDAPLMTSVIVLGEIQFGIQMAPPSMQCTLPEFFERVCRQLPRVLEIDKSTAAIHADLKAKLFKKFGPRKGSRKGWRLDKLTDPDTSLELSIQENDLWIAAQAVERNLVLVSNDKMQRIRDATPELNVEDWGGTGRLNP